LERASGGAGGGVIRSRNVVRQDPALPRVPTNGLVVLREMPEGAEGGGVREERGREPIGKGGEPLTQGRAWSVTAGLV